MSARRPTGARPPNVVLVISDQQRADTMPGVRPDGPVRTPHLEWLAGQGALFRNAYCTDPVCTPARAALLSGLYPHTTGVVANHQERPVSDEMHLPADVRLLADHLRPLGYACAYAGKWHLGTGADRRGFADFATHSGDYDVDGPEQNEILRFARRVGLAIGGKGLGYDPDPADYDRRLHTGRSLLPLAWHPSAQDAVRAAGFVRRLEADDRPLLLVYSCHEPHEPFASPEPFHSRYAGARDELPLPATRRETAGPELLRARGDRKLLPVAGLSDDDLRRMWAAYYGAIGFVDHLVGTLLAALVETGRWEDTLFVYTADHGEMLGSHGVYRKGAALYEELAGIPLLIRPPGGLSAAHQTPRLVSHVDLAPTILRWCGAPVPAELPGADLRPLVEGGDAPVREGVLLQYHSGNWGERPIPLRGWRTERWKYVEGQDGPQELYDLRDDPLEARNVVADPARAAARAALGAQLRAELLRTGDRWPDVRTPERLVPVAGAAAAGG